MPDKMAQVPRFLILLAMACAIWRVLSVTLEPLPAAFAAGGGAAIAAVFWHDGRWWIPIHALFLPALLLLLQADVPAYWYLIILVVLWLFSGQAVRQRVPLYTSGQGALRALCELLPHGSRFIDVGAGTGTVLQALARSRPDLILAGTELAWFPWLIGSVRMRGCREWYRQDYRKMDFACYDCVYAFLSPEPMPELWSKAKREMRPGSLFISNSFPVPGVEPDEMIDYGDWKGGQLLLWRM
ncbi:class I SAM-dependent methyltransferase [Chitinilyticum aquatile]|uniref:class I SAM-dependent methyltransferase n=1 Tax=Chitinilyticum aquatile TaxID=362520 RepID=UPI00048F3939|nr:class I SAM-dependent methyltransferase [Chitinilyticum aquatile]